MPVYFLHAEFDLRNPVNGDAPDRDCVHTVGGPKPLPPQVIGSDKVNKSNVKIGDHLPERMMHYTYNYMMN